MAVNVQIYGNSAGREKTVVVDFVGDVLISNDDPFGTDVEYYFKLTTAARDTDGNLLPTKVIRSLSELALNGTVQSASNTSSAYTDIDSMVVDYLYDYVNGHAANKYSSGATEQKPMSFSY